MTLILSRCSAGVFWHVLSKKCLEEESQDHHWSEWPQKLAEPLPSFKRKHHHTIQHGPTWSECFLHTEEILGNLKILPYTCTDFKDTGYLRAVPSGTKYLQRTLYHTACSTESIGCRTKTCCLKEAGDPRKLIPEYFPPVDLTKKDLYLSHPVLKKINLKIT